MVSPYTGEWIEIKMLRKDGTCSTSLLTQESGLKFGRKLAEAEYKQSLLTQESGLK